MSIAFVIVISAVILDDGCVGFDDETLGPLIEFGREEIGVDALNQEIFQSANVLCREVKLLGQVLVGNGQQRRSVILLLAPSL